jgi:hypothetical protein
MFRINNETNRISKISKMKFSEIGVSERNHLQEWLANQPDALGEELLIIQKEFDGFDDTRERLDLLAIDKAGGLVIIENKLDDSGRDVVWQALKYASYCSTLSKAKIAEIYQRYLDKSNLGRDAQALICEFLEKEDFAEVDLNSGIDQRVVMVAAEFRKEVTSTALWLLKHKIKVKCFKATPYKDGNDLFLSIDQLIPLPEAEDLMIGIAEKEQEEQSVEKNQATRYQLRTAFWHRMLEALDQAGVNVYGNVAPSKDHWLYAGSGLSGVQYTMILNQDEARVEFALSKGSREVNKYLFDLLLAKASEIEARFGEKLIWDRLNEKKSSIIRSVKAFDGHNRDAWPELIAWMVDHVKRMERSFGPEVPRLRVALQQMPMSSAG